MMNKDKIILHLCADVGSDSIFYKNAGYNVICIGKDIGVENYNPPENVYGIIANPPCTHFSIARCDKTAKEPRNLEEGMILVKECLRIIWACIQNQYQSPSHTMPLKFWVIENPATGFLRWFLGKPVYEYSPHEFGEDYTNRTALWGIFNHPIKPFWINQLNAGRSLAKDIITPMNCKSQKERMAMRSMCSPKFAKAFYEANP